MLQQFGNHTLAQLTMTYKRISGTEVLLGSIKVLKNTCLTPLGVYKNSITSATGSSLYHSYRICSTYHYVLISKGVISNISKCLTIFLRKEKIKIKRRKKARPCSHYLDKCSTYSTAKLTIS